MYLLINDSLSHKNCFYGYYNRNTDRLYIRDDADTKWLGRRAPGSFYTIENSYVELNCGDTLVSNTETTLKIVWCITFKSAFTGAKNIYLYTKDNANARSNWTKSGTWTITNRSPSSGDVVTSHAGPGYTCSFKTTYSDPDGWKNIKYVYFLTNTSNDGKDCIYSYYDQNIDKLYLRNDDNTAWLGGCTPGSEEIIENSYGVLNCSDIQVTGIDTNLIIIWDITFKSTFIGERKNIYLNVKDDADSNSGWAQKGTWLIEKRYETGSSEDIKKD